MTRIKIKELIWDEYNIEHIKKHGINQREVIIAVEHFVYHKQAYSGRYMLVGRVEKRILSIVVKRKKTSVYYVVTARDADKKERKRLYEKEGGK